MLVSNYNTTQSNNSHTHNSWDILQISDGMNRILGPNRYQTTRSYTSFMQDIGPVSQFLHLPTNYWPFERGIHLWQVDSTNKGPVTAELWFFFNLNKLLNKKSSCQWFGIPWGACDITMMYWMGVFQRSQQRTGIQVCAQPMRDVVTK